MEAAAALAPLAMEEPLDTEGPAATSGAGTGAGPGAGTGAGTGAVNNSNVMLGLLIPRLHGSTYKWNKALLVFVVF